MSKNQNIRVSRYTAQDAAIPGAACADGSFAWAASVAPEDGSWCLFVPTPAAAAKGATPQLWHLVGSTEEVDGEDVYALDGSPEHQAYLEAMPKAS